MMNHAKDLLLCCRKGLGFAGRFLKKNRIPATLISMVLVLSMLMSVITVSIRKVTVFDENKQVQSYYSMEFNQEAILEKNGIILHEKDEMEILEQDGEIIASITRAFPVTIFADGKSHKVMTTGGTVREIIDEAGILYGEDDIISSDLNAVVAEGSEITIKRITNGTITETEEIPFETITKNTDSLYKGQTAVESEGRCGEKVLTYAVTYTDGVETGRELISSEVTKEAEDRVVLKGTKIRSSFKKTSSTPTNYRRAIAMTATAYVQGGTTATGRPAKVGVVAVDPNVIPLGTRVYVETADGRYIYGTAIAADTGGAIKGNKIDICVASHSEAINFGRRTVNVYILD